MASPSHSEKTHCNHSQVKDQKDWLELGLGFSIACRRKEDDVEEELDQANPVSGASASSLLQQAKHNNPTQTHGCCSEGLELGLSLGIDSRRMRRRSAAGILELAPPPATASNYDHQSLWKSEEDDHDEHELGHEHGEDHHYYYDDDDDDDDNMAWWRSCDMNYSGRSLVGFQNDHEDCQMPVPQNPHDYFFTRSTTRPHSGLWFTLQSYTNRNGEALPQIPKAYIRVKDENVTVFMVQKYLVRKLGLSNEAEVDISCMGQKLLQTQTLKQVRDCVWLPRFVDSVNPTSTTVSIQNNYSHHQTCVNHHLLSLQYGRRCSSTFN